ncbi:MAG: cation:proton antiporter, partial [Deltaproteobacteria bacterium]
IAVLAMVSAIFRPLDGGNWRLPPLGWVFVQIGMGAALGALTLGLQRAARNVNEEVALTLGAVAFASGMASYLGFSPLTIGCVAGVVITNVTAGEENAEFVAELRGLERPIFMVFFAVAGSLWDIHDWRGWVVIPLFVIARALGKIGGARAGLLGERARASSPSQPEAFPDARRLGVALIPTSAVSIAVVISATQSYTDIPAWLESVAIVGAIAAELLFQFFLLAVPRAPRPPSVPPPGATEGST